MQTMIDQAVPVRAGEELDGTRIDAFLKTQIEGLHGQPEISQFPGGASNLTYLLRYANRDLVLRRPPFGQRAKSAHDMLREARIMMALKPVYARVPEVLALGQAGTVMDCDFYVMERISGIIPRQDLPAALGLDASATHSLCLNVLDCLIELHTVDYREAGLDGLGRGEGYVARQIEGWCERMQKARTEDVGDFANVMGWLRQKQPATESTICLIHNDFRFDNLVLNADNPLEVIGVLDWEMATLGDPLMDLGSTLAYWVQADDDAIYQQMRRQPTNAPGMLSRQQVIDYYAEKTGRHVDNFDFYLIYGLFRLAGIAQQIYRRFRDGQARNAQFAAFGPMVNYLEQRCSRLIAHSKL